MKKPSKRNGQRFGRKWDPADLHEYLWKQTDRFGRVQIHQRKWAADLGMGTDTLNILMKGMERAGRIKKIGTRQGNIGVYVIRDPDNEEEWMKIPIVPATAKPPKLPPSPGVSTGI